MASSSHVCGLFYLVHSVRKYLPQVKLSAHISIVSSASRTTLTQTFVNPDSSGAIKEVKYAFPLYDGVSVVGFTCTVGDRVIKGIVKEKQQARHVYREAVDRGEAAALLEQLHEAADVFVTSVGNIPAGASVVVQITYLGELKHDAEVDGIRFTMPTQIAPRYGQYPGDLVSTRTGHGLVSEGGIEITVDAEMAAGSVIRSMQCTSHPISVNIGTTSAAPGAEPSLRKASATLSLGSSELDKDFVLHVIATNSSNPVAVLEEHPTFPHQRALMATLVPKFSLPPERPEIVFVCDRSGSMGVGNKITNLKTALHIFLKSMPVGVKFNICSFGSRHSLLWDRSRTYDQDTLDQATRHVDSFAANYGGTEMYRPIEEVISKRYTDMNLEVFLLTDGDIWDQERLLGLITSKVAEASGAIRAFTLGIGTGASSSLVEGVARAGNGFSQLVGDNEKMNSKVVRMLKGALSPHIHDYSLEVVYESDVGGGGPGASASATDDDEFELVDRVEDCPVIATETPDKDETQPAPKKETISLFDPMANPDAEVADAKKLEARYEHLPPVPIPSLLQAPFRIPTLFPFNRTSVYLLMSESTKQRQVKSVVLRGSSVHGPLELEIPVTTLAEPGETIHQLAARKAIKELEEGNGWLHHAVDGNRRPLREKHDGHFSDMVEREAVRLGLRYQVGGKWCSFVAVDENNIDGDGVMRHETTPASCDVIDKTHGKVGASKLRPKAQLIGAPRPPPPPAPLPSAYGTGTGPGPGTRVRSQAQAFASLAPGGTMMIGGAGGGGTLAAVAPATDGYHPMSQSASFSLAAYDDECEEDLCVVPSAATSGKPMVQSMMESKELAGGGSLRRASRGGDEEERGSRSKSRGGLGSTSFGFLSSSKSRKRDATPVAESASIPVGRAVAAPAAAPAPAPAVPRPTPSPVSRDPLEAIVTLQTFEGFWALSDELLQVLGISKDQIESALSKKNVTWAQSMASEVEKRMAVTACVIVFLESKLRGEKDTWEMMVEKARDWLSTVVLPLGARVDEVEETFRSLFR